MAESIGILGGTFDPIHFGHLRLALDVAQQLNLDHIRLIPSARPPHRDQPQATPEQRLTMLHLAVKNSEQLLVDDRELHRQGASYTIDTLESLRQDFPDNPLYLLIGSDAFLHIQTWHRWQELLDLAHIVVMKRPSEPAEMSEQLTHWYQQNLATSNDSSQVAGKIWPVKVTQLSISASQIRLMFEQGKDPQYLMPNSVIELIEMLAIYPRKN